MSDVELFNEVYNRAIKIIGMAAQSERNLRTKLLQKKYQLDVIDKVIDELKESGYIDDKSNGYIYAKNLYKYKYYGKMMVISKLINRGIEKNSAEKIAAQVLEEFGGEDIILQEYIDNKESISQLYKSDKNKLYGKLQQRGFSIYSIKRVFTDFND